MRRGSLQILRLRRIPDPRSLLTTELRLPVHLALDKFRHRIVRSLAKHPLLTLEVVMAAGKRHRQQFSRLHKLNLPPVHFLAQRVNDRRFRVLRFQGRHHLAHSLRKVHCHRRMQSFRTLQPNVSVQHPEIRSRCRLMKRPLQPYAERQSFQRHPDFLAGSHLRRLATPAVLMQLRHKPASLFFPRFPCETLWPPWLSISESEFYRRPYLPSSVDRTFSARSTLVKGFCNSFTPGSSTLCCITMSSVYPVMYTILVCGRLLRIFSANCRPLIPGMMTSVNNKLIGSLKLSEASIACSAVAASSTL